MALACLAAGISPIHAAEAPLTTGNSTVVRRDVTFALHIPESLSKPHGPAGIFIFFGGKDDTTEMYQLSLTNLADSLDLVVVVPQMPWFKDPGKVPEIGVVRALDVLVGEIEKQFQTTPAWVIVGGVSAGGEIAYQLASKWSSKVALLVLASTGPLPNIPKKTFHVVAAAEIELLGPDGKQAPILGRGKKDVFAIPGGHHTAQIEYVEPWLQSEVSAMRLGIAGQTMQAANQALMVRDAAKAEAIVQSTYLATTILGQQAPGTNSFFEYEKKYREDLLKKDAKTIESLTKLRTKIATTK